MFKITLKVFALIAALALFFTACQDDAVKSSDAVGSAAAVIPVSGDITTNTTWGTIPGDIYRLDGLVRVRSNATLTILAGTRIIGSQGTSTTLPGTLMIEKDGALIANGTATNPIVFTSSRGENLRAPGDWGGVIILGEAPVCFTGTPRIEGIPQDPALPSSGTYGGSTPGDDSGSLSYVRIEYAGFIVQDGNETNGLTLGGVGTGTEISHVQVSFGSDDGFEFFGGTVNADHLVAYRNADDDFDTDRGWSGTVSYAVSIRDTNVTNGETPGSNGFESNGDDDDASSSSCYTSGTFTHVTLVGPARPRSGCDANVDADYNDGILLRDESRLSLTNSAIFGYPRYQIEEQNAGATGTLSGLVIGVPDITNAGLTPDNRADTTNPSGLIINGVNNNSIRLATGCVAASSNTLDEVLGLPTAAWNLPTTNAAAAPNLRPLSGSILLTGGVGGTFRGAFDTTDGTWDIYDGSTWVDWAPNDD